MTSVVKDVDSDEEYYFSSEKPLSYASDNWGGYVSVATAKDRGCGEKHPNGSYKSLPYVSMVVDDNSVTFFIIMILPMHYAENRRYENTVDSSLPSDTT